MRRGERKRQEKMEKDRKGERRERDRMKDKRNRKTLMYQ